jgi:lipoate-protein ligase A
MESTFVSLPEAAGRAVTWDQFNSAFQDGFSRFLSIELLPGNLSKDEESLAEELYVTKYATDDWLFGNDS